MTYHKSHGFEPDVSRAKIVVKEREILENAVPRSTRFLGNGRREEQINKPGRKKAGLL